MDEILLQENQKVSADKGANKNIESDFDENKLYQIDNMSLDNTKENFNDVSVRLNVNLEINMGFKTIMV